MSKKEPIGIAQTFEKIRADYDMSRQSRFIRRRTGVNPMGSGADYHYRSESKYYSDMEQARDMDRNDPLVGILADRRVDNIVQSGFTLDPKTGDRKLDLDLFQRWEAETTDPDLCDIAGEMTWKEIERHVCRAESIDGDIIVTGTDEGRFQVLEAHLIQTRSSQPNTFLGVTTDSVGRRLQYWYTEELDEFGGKGESIPIDVRDENGVRQLFHVYNPKRVMQTRGVTQLAPVFAYSGMLEDINFAKLVQQQIVSCFAIFRKMGMPTSDTPSVDSEGYGEASTERTDSGTRQLDNVSPGMEIIGQYGEELQGFSPNVPNSEYFQQVKLILQVIGVNFGLPLCLVLMDGSETNFSGWRGAVDEARKGFVADQLNLVRRLHTPAYRWKLNQWINSDPAIARAAKANPLFFSHNWNLPTWSYIEPVADAEGDATQLKYALTSPRRMHAARGKDWEEISEEIAEDNTYAIEIAMKAATKINAANPTQPAVTWRDLMPLPMPAGQTIALQDPAAVAVQEAAIEGDEAAQPTGEMAGLSRQQYKNNKKAIDEILAALIDGTTTPSRASVDFAMLGLSPETIRLLIEDVSDGTIDTPELKGDA